ncbi:GNAT family N-acetyltransferase [Jannaschia sp. W003]|uniref:GNAT family N-acetyltransferase n=1 Tax=Jannaschia sp. W003 TaxID=2867012 RepID=UPI0021A81BA8|nr:GNAT family N-acetyltransferase [Jannaschia sp. W003]UWQ22543.1 GNAT family N-acetyltransferase [Jannaschia sp. W003]
MRVRRLGEADAEAAAALVRETFGAMHRETGMDSPSRRIDAAGVRAKLAEGAGFGAEAGGALLGVAFTRPSRDVPGALYLGPVATDADARGRGVARTLVEAALDEARANGAPAVTLDTWTGEAGPRGYFARLGFAEHAREGRVVTMLRPV